MAMDRSIAMLFFALDKKRCGYEDCRYVINCIYVCRVVLYHCKIIADASLTALIKKDIKAFLHSICSA